MHPRLIDRFTVLALSTLFCSMLLSGCSDSSSSKFEGLTTRDFSAEPLRKAVDHFRLQPSDDTRSAVVSELAALDAHIEDLADHAEISEGRTKAQFLCDAEANLTARKFSVERFNAPIEQQAQVSISKAEKADIEDAPKAVAVAVAPPPELPVRRAISVGEPPIAVAQAVVSDTSADEIPVRRAVAVNSLAESFAQPASNTIVFRSQDSHRITIWHSGSYSSELARR